MGVGKTVAVNEQGLPSDINSVSQWGLAAAIPATENVLAGSFYYATDTKILYQEQNGSWDSILSIKAIVATNDTYEAGYHVGNAGGLDAIDTDLAPANIKAGVTIFGKLGTLKTTLAEDTLESNLEADVASAITSSRTRDDNIGAGADYTIATFNDTYNASSMAVGVGFLNGLAEYGSNIKFRLYMGGVQVAESGTLPNSHVNVIAIATKALSGLHTVYCALHNYSGATQNYTRSARETGGIVPGAVAAGSIKLT